jgi:hypothetical protein
MSILLGLSCRRVEKWFVRLETEGVRIKTGRTGLKLMKETKEFYDAPSLPEAADVFVSLLGACYSEGWTAQDLAIAVQKKMDINEQRTWALQDDGTYQHT